MGNYMDYYMAYTLIDMKRRSEEADDLLIDLTFFCQNAVV